MTDNTIINKLMSASTQTILQVLDYYKSDHTVQIKTDLENTISHYQHWEKNKKLLFWDWEFVENSLSLFPECKQYITGRKHAEFVEACKIQLAIWTKRNEVVSQFVDLVINFTANMEAHFDIQKIRHKCTAIRNYLNVKSGPSCELCTTKFEELGKLLAQDMDNARITYRELIMFLHDLVKHGDAGQYLLDHINATLIIQ
jgi:hypothetical protein